LSRGDEAETPRPAAGPTARAQGAGKARAQTDLVFAGNELAIVGQF